MRTQSFQKWRCEANAYFETLSADWFPAVGMVNGEESEKSRYARGLIGNRSFGHPSGYLLSKPCCLINKLKDIRKGESEVRQLVALV